ncbi:MAG: anaerobic ribonucleoside-triphosphate reductase activating protein [Alcaligenaceae bacterium]|jgi:anaerobic ribonucleoside-triphosphate reductase activating protein|nr:anaerobic ribonucleoside-triphosphate reductase activating protein [Alcaligenaceae bacterium]
MQKLRYLHEEVVWIEVPGEVSLAYQFTGCPLRCKGCHSADTWKLGTGKQLSPDYFRQRLVQYQNLITCVLFMGGEWQSEQLLPYLRLAQEANLKTCLYTGLEKEEVPTELLPYLDYLKVGPWIAELGGLDNPNTNQRFIDQRTGAVLNHLFY